MISTCHLIYGQDHALELFVGTLGSFVPAADILIQLGLPKQGLALICLRSMSKGELLGSSSLACEFSMIKRFKRPICERNEIFSSPHAGFSACHKRKEKASYCLFRHILHTLYSVCVVRNSVLVHMSAL